MAYEEIKNLIKESIECKEEFYSQIDNLDKAAQAIIECYKKGNKVLIFGNGGSAADSQHIAAELIGRFKHERRSLPAIALTTNSSNITALGNDYSFDIVFSRQIEALASKGDVLIGISTSGKSKNVIEALRKGREKGTFNITLTGNGGGTMKQLSDVNIDSSSTNTPRIQECHILAYHIICELVEKEIMNI